MEFPSQKYKIGRKIRDCREKASASSFWVSAILKRWHIFRLTVLTAFIILKFWGASKCFCLCWSLSIFTILYTKIKNLKYLLIKVIINPFILT